MNKKTQYIILGVVTLLIISTISFSMLWKPKSLKGTAAQPTTNFETKSTGSTGNEDVQIDLTPYESGNQLTLKLTANTHSVDLSQFNLKEMVTLEAEGETYKPSSSPSLSGHHASGNLMFSTKVPKNFKI